MYGIIRLNLNEIVYKLYLNVETKLKSVGRGYGARGIMSSVKKKRKYKINKHKRKKRRRRDKHKT